MAESRIAAMTFCVMAAFGGSMLAASAQTVTGSRPPLAFPPVTQPAVAPPAGMPGGIGSGFGEQPNRKGTVRGAGATGAGASRNPALNGANGPGTGMVPKPVGQGE